MSVMHSKSKAKYFTLYFTLYSNSYISYKAVYVDIIK